MHARKLHIYHLPCTHIYMQYTTARTDDVALVVLTPSQWSKSLYFTRLDQFYERALDKKNASGLKCTKNHRLTDGKSGS